MKHLDVTYTNGVIAAREKKLLGDRVLRLCELDAEEAFRALLETGFGGGAETTANVYEYEKLIAKEEQSLDEFIREYAPSDAEQAYFLAPRDFHNAKALIKAAFLGVDAQSMLSPDGFLSADWLKERVATGDFSAIKEKNEWLGSACEDATALLSEEPNGAKVGEIFEKALYVYLYAVAKKNKTLKALLTAKTDMTNILTAFRAGEEWQAEEKYLPTGNSDITKKLRLLFQEDEDKIKRVFSATVYADFVSACLQAKRQGKPMTEAERMRDGYEEKFFAKRKYELVKNEPFLYYVYRRQMECVNVRIVFVCLLAGLREQEIKNRLRAK